MYNSTNGILTVFPNTIIYFHQYYWLSAFPLNAWHLYKKIGI